MPLVSQVPDFINYYALEVRNDEVVTIGIFDTQTGEEDSIGASCLLAEITLQKSDRCGITQENIEAGTEHDLMSQKESRYHHDRTHSYRYVCRSSLSLRLSKRLQITQAAR